MPLHLLGKKSWNVYNTANVEKVKRDEAAAAARDEAEEQRMNEVDAERRIKLLRGHPVEDLAKDTEKNLEKSTRRPSERDGRDRKRRKVYGEDDTERDIRYAKEVQTFAPSSADVTRSLKKNSDAPLTDRDGHISLFPEEASRYSRVKNPEAEAEMAKKKREYEDQYTMRFSNAGGFKNNLRVNPWYSSASDAKADGPGDVVSKNSWGNPDPRRKEREKMRIAADDPLAAIQRGVQGVRRSEKDRQAWKVEQRREVDELVDMEKRKARKRRLRSHKPTHRDDTLSERASRAEGDDKRRKDKAEHRLQEPETELFLEGFDPDGGNTSGKKRNATRNYVQDSARRRES